MVGDIHHHAINVVIWLGNDEAPVAMGLVGSCHVIRERDKYAVREVFLAAL